MQKFFLFFVVLAVLASHTVKNYLLSRLPGPWYVEGLYALVPLLSLLCLTIHLVNKALEKNTSREGLNIENLQRSDCDKLLFIDGFLQVDSTKYIVQLYSVEKTPKGILLKDKWLRTVDVKPPFERGYVYIRQSIWHIEHNQFIYSIAELK